MKFKIPKRTHLLEGIAHLLVWLLFFTSINIDWSINWFNTENRIGPVAPLSAVVFFLFFYLNAFYLIPKYLKTRKWWTYGLALVLTCAAFEAIRLLLFYLFTRPDWQNSSAFFNELQSEDSLIVGRLNPLFVSLQFSLVYRFALDWIVNNVVIDRLQTEKLQMELSVLKAQVNPHFLFNSLNALDDLIDRDPSKAKTYLSKLSKIYRYTLTSMDQDIVPLSEELDFISDYIFLLEERFGGMYIFEKKVSEKSQDCFIPPASLQLLLENAVKHNYGSLSDPLRIMIDVSDTTVTVHHPKRLKKTDTSSIGKGLANIKKRFQFLSNQPMVVEDSLEQFSVSLPLMKSIGK